MMYVICIASENNSPLNKPNCIINSNKDPSTTIWKERVDIRHEIVLNKDPPLPHIQNLSCLYQTPCAFLQANLFVEP